MAVLKVKENNEWKEIQAIKGSDGSDGHTPVKGVDYFTEEDIESLDIPRKTSDLINDEGFTSNEGTITEVRMNGTSKGTSGVVDLGTVITQHQDISGKVDKVPDKGLSENDFTDADKANLDSNTATRHTHTNKQILDTTTAPYTTVDKANLDNNTSARHTHTNKSTIDGITSSDIENWNNKADESDIPDVSDFITKDVDDLTNYYTKTQNNTLLNAKQNEITSSNMLLSDLVNDTNQTNKFVTASEKTTWNGKADAGFTGIISGTSANPTDGATLPNGVYKASESQNTSYISLPMEDGTTKRQSVQKGGIVIRTTARLEIYATQVLMYQYDTSNQYFYPAESLVESNLRREYDDGLAYLGTVSPPNNVFITTPITELEATINTEDTGHVRITFTVGDGVAEGDFYLGLTDTEGNDLLYTDGATPKPVSGETWILEFYGNTCEPICFKATDGKSREDLLKQFIRRNSDQIYYPSLDGKPNISIMAAKGYEQDRKVGLEAQNIEFTNFENWTYYGIPNYVPLDLSLYNTNTHANMLQPYTQLPDGDYWVKNPGKIWLGNESYELIGREYIHKKGTVLTVWGGEYACAYYAWNSTDEVYEGGFFITYQDLLDYISEQGFEKGYTITRQTTATGSIVMNDGRHYKRVRETGVTSLTFSLVNSLGEVPDTFKTRVTLRTATTFTEFNITQRDAYKLYFMGDDCANGVITGVANKYYDIEFKADGFGDVVGIVHSYELPTT